MVAEYDRSEISQKKKPYRTLENERKLLNAEENEEIPPTKKMEKKDNNFNKIISLLKKNFYANNHRPLHCHQQYGFHRH